MAADLTVTLATYFVPILQAMDAVLDTDLASKFLLGPEYLPAMQPTPRVVWIPTQDTFDAAYERERDRKASLDSISGFTAVLFGVDFDSVRQMKSAFLVALANRTTVPQMQAVGGEWYRRGDNRPEGWSHKGEAYGLAFTVREAIVAPKLQSVVIEAEAIVPFVDTTQGDGLLDGGEET